MCSGKLTAAENQHKMVDPMRLFLFRNLLHHLAARVVNQKVRVGSIENLHFSLKLSRFAFDVTSTFVFFLARLAESFFVNGIILFLLAAILSCLFVVAYLFSRFHLFDFVYQLIFYIGAIRFLERGGCRSASLE
jgi:hypothetical protein